MRIQVIAQDEVGLTEQFAIKSTIRNHDVLKREEVIKHIADIVGTNHKVDLSNPDYFVIIDIYKVSKPSLTPLSQTHFSSLRSKKS